MQAPLTGRSILIVEDEPLIAMDMAGRLAEAIEKKQAELDAAEEDLGRHTGTLEDQMTTKLHRVRELQREVIGLEAQMGAGQPAMPHPPLPLRQPCSSDLRSRRSFRRPAVAPLSATQS
jgi:hypothetical protein